MATFTDIDLTLKPHPGTGDILKKTDVNAVKQSIKNILFAAPYDVPFDFHYGANLRNMLFELSSPSLFAVTKRQILIMLTDYEPRAIIEELYVAESPDTNGVNIGIRFYVVGNPEKQTISYTLTRTS